MRHRLTIAPLLVLVTWVTVLSADEKADEFSKPTIEHVVIEPATKQTPRSDTTSIAALSDGRIMVVYHKYEGGERSGHDHGVCRIWSKVSDDWGKFWGDARMLVDVAKGDMNVQALSLIHI